MEKNKEKKQYKKPCEKTVQPTSGKTDRQNAKKCRRDYFVDLYFRNKQKALKNKQKEPNDGTIEEKLFLDLAFLNGYTKIDVALVGEIQAYSKKQFNDPECSFIKNYLQSRLALKIYEHWIVIPRVVLQTVLHLHQIEHWSPSRRHFFGETCTPAWERLH